MKGKLKVFFINLYKVLKYVYIIIKASNEEVINNIFVNNLMYFKSNYLEIKSRDKCKIIIIVLVLKFLRFIYIKSMWFV